VVDEYRPIITGAAAAGDHDREALDQLLLVRVVVWQRNTARLIAPASSARPSSHTTAV